MADCDKHIIILFLRKPKHFKHKLSQIYFTLNILVEVALLFQVRLFRNLQVFFVVIILLWVFLSKKWRYVFNFFQPRDSQNHLLSLEITIKLLHLVDRGPSVVFDVAPFYWCKFVLSNIQLCSLHLKLNVLHDFLIHQLLSLELLFYKLFGLAVNLVFNELDLFFNLLDSKVC